MFAARVVLRAGQLSVRCGQPYLWAAGPGKRVTGRAVTSRGSTPKVAPVCVTVDLRTTTTSQAADFGEVRRVGGIQARGTRVALAFAVMKPWFLLLTLWALSGIVALRTVYAEDASVMDQLSANSVE